MLSYTRSGRKAEKFHFAGNFNNANLINTNFNSAKPCSANLNNANCYKANFRSAKLNNANLTQANFDENLDQSVYVEAGLSSFVNRGAENASYRTDQLTVNLAKLDTDSTINPDNY